jgi:hypothetical protein
MRVAMIVSLLVASSAFAQGNSCSDPYWKDTLRCAFFPTQPPQPNLDEVPELGEDVMEVPQFTRVFLENSAVRCTDGTKPLIYVDKAICTNESGCGGSIRRGDPIESDRWIITMSGGGACVGGECVDFYNDAEHRIFMGSATKPAVKDMDGIHDADAVRNPVFAGYNRVRVEKCTFDRYMGRFQDVKPGGAHAGDGPRGRVSANVYYHGYLIMEEAFKALQTGLHYTTWRLNEPQGEGASNGRRRACCAQGAGSRLIRAQEKLPPLADAETVLLIGHSNAAHGLYHNVDNLAAALAAIPGFKADVRALFDENFLPSVENEAGIVNPALDLYDGIWSGTSSARGETFSYDGQAYHTTHRIDQQYLAWRAALDASCLSAHAEDGTTLRCHDRQHVLFNHVTTPFMVREDFEDPNGEHLEGGGHDLEWGSPRSFTYCQDPNPCFPRLTPGEFRQRIEKQISTLISFSASKSELARGIDRSASGLPTMYAWMPACGQHDGSFIDPGFYGTTISNGTTSFTMRTWLEQFMSSPRAAVRQYQIDGVRDPGGQLTRTTKCR